MGLSQCEPEEFLFLGGDFNCTEKDLLDRNHVEPHAVSKRVMKQLVEAHRENAEKTFFLWLGLTGSPVLNPTSVFLRKVNFYLLSASDHSTVS